LLLEDITTIVRSRSIGQDKRIYNQKSFNKRLTIDRYIIYLKLDKCSVLRLAGWDSLTETYTIDIITGNLTLGNDAMRIGVDGVI